MQIIEQTHPKPTKSRHKKLLDDPDVKRWYENIARGSRVTADVRLRRLGVYCERTSTTPKEFAQIGIKSVKEIEDILLDYVSFLEKKGYAPSYIEDILKALRSWLSFNYVKLVRKIKIKNADIPVTLENEEIPSKAKLLEVLDSASARARVIISFIALSGVRPEVLGKYDYSDGLQLSDIKDLEIKQNGSDVVFGKIPAKVVVRPNLSKAGHQYFTYLPDLGCRFLQGYLRERIAAGEKIDASSPVVTVMKGYRKLRPTKNTQRKTFFLATNTVTGDIREAFGIIIKERPYVLRSYFDTQLLLAESKGRITHAYRQFFMGHKGDIEAKYTTNKNKLPEHLIKDMGEAYLRSQDFLLPTVEHDQSVNEKSKKELFLEIWQEQAKLFGINPLELKIERQRDAESADNKIDAIKKAILKKFQENREPNNTGENQYESKLISGEDELLTLVENGWQIVKELSNGKIILRRNRITTTCESD